MGAWPLFSIDRFSLFKRVVAVSGWAFGEEAPITHMTLRFPGGRSYPVGAPGLPSPDVAAGHGAKASRCRFDVQVVVDDPDVDLLAADLQFHTAEGAYSAGSLSQPTLVETTHWLTEEFHGLLGGKPAGRYLEIGSRARSGIVRRSLAPEGWSYTGLDVMAGDNVDVVGDAHRLSKLFPDRRFDAVSAFSVLEHIMMPWKFAIELNRVLNVGAVGLFTTHQCWPIHDAPWDFWRFSDTAWAALLNPKTGFEILHTALGEPAYVVPGRCHAVTNFGDATGGYLSSAVLFRKTGETVLDWPVELEDITDTAYPTTRLPA